MVLNVLFCAGAVPLRPDDHHHQQQQQTQHRQQPAQPHPTADNNSAEYVQFLEQLVGELSHVFVQWVHQNPVDGLPPHNMNIRNQQQPRCRDLSPLPDVIPHHGSNISGGKWSTSTPCSTQDLRVRRGLGPMRFRLDSVGSVASSSASQTPTSPSPMNFDLLTPTSSASTSSFFSDDYSPTSFGHQQYYYQSEIPSPVPTASQTTAAAAEADASTDATDASSSSSGQWRQIGRDLRGIADQFASTRQTNNQEWLSSSWSFLSLLSPLTSPLVSALAVYLWWKIVKRVSS